MEPPIPDNIKPSEVDTDTCDTCEEEVVLEDEHTNHCTWCGIPCHESCMATHEDSCSENQEDK